MMQFFDLKGDSSRHFSDLFYKSDEPCEISYYDMLKIEEVMMNTGREYLNEFNILSTNSGNTNVYLGSATYTDSCTGELVLIVTDEHPQIYTVVDSLYDEGEFLCGYVRWIEDEYEMYKYLESVGASKDRYKNRLREIDWSGGEKVLAFFEWYIIHDLYKLRVFGYGGNGDFDTQDEDSEYERDLHHLLDMNIPKGQSVYTVFHSDDIRYCREADLADWDRNMQKQTIPADGSAYSVLQEQIAEVLDTFSEREKKIIAMRFGLNDGHPRPLNEIGPEFHVTRERIRQIEAKVMHRLRHPRRSKKPRDYLE